VHLVGVGDVREARKFPSVEAWLGKVARWLDQEPSVTAVHGVEIAYLAVLAVLVLAGWFGLLLGELGYFSVGAIGAFLVLAVVGVVFWLWRTPYTFPII